MLTLPPPSSRTDGQGSELLARAERLAAGLPPGSWSLVEPGTPGRATEVVLDAHGLVRMHEHEALGALGFLSRYALFLAAWLWSASRDPDAPVRFRWSSVAAALGDGQPSAAMSDQLRIGLDRLCHPMISHLELDVRATGSAAWPRAGVTGFFRALARHQRGDGMGRAGVEPIVVAPEASMAAALAEGSWSSVPLPWLRRAPSDLLRRLAYWSSVATARPVDPDRIVRVEADREALLAALGVTDRRTDRVLRRLETAVAQLGELDPRYAGSDGRGSGGRVLIMRRLPLDVLPGSVPSEAVPAGRG